MNKGFLFTVSVIIFASTLVFFTQSFLQVSFDNEKSILDAQPFFVGANLNDDLAFDLERIVGISVDVNSGNDLNILFTGSFPQDYDIGTKISEYKAFLDTNYFTRIGGTQDINVVNLIDGNAELFIGDVLLFESVYSDSNINISPVSSNSLIGLDINITTTGNRDFNFLPSDTGVVPLDFNYIDTNSLNPIISTRISIDPSVENKITLRYSDGDINLVIGSTPKGTDSLQITSNSTRQINYSILLMYSTGKVYLPVRFNSELKQLNELDSNSLIKIRN